MGFLFRPEGTRRIIDTLNTAFDGPTPANQPLKGLDFIRSILADTNPGDIANQKIAKKIKKGQWKPGHLAKMLRLYPFDQAGTPQTFNRNDNARWVYFLKFVLGYTDSTASTTTPQFNTIRSTLVDAITSTDSLGNFKIIRVAFDHVELENSTDNPNVVIFDASPSGSSAGPFVRHITLFTVPAANGKTSTYDNNDNDEADLPDSPNPPWQSTTT